MSGNYRKCNTKLAAARLKELKNILPNFISNLDIGVIEGSKVLEVKNTNINKHRAVLRWIANKHRAFILTVSDYLTDEDTLASLPNIAFSIKAYFGPSLAKFHVESVADIGSLWSKLSTAR